MLTLMKSLSQGIRAITAEHAVPSDPATFSEESARQKLGLVFPADVVERFLAMLNGTVEFTATSAATKETQLNKAMFAEVPAIRQVSCNETRAEQKLTFRGVLFDEQKKALKDKLSSVLKDKTSSDVFAALLDVFAVLLNDIETQAHGFFTKYLLKQKES